MKSRSELSAGGVVCRRRERGIEVLLGEQRDRNTRQQTTRLPKGHVREGESLEQAAVREVLEETGCPASIRERLDEVSYRFLEQSDGVEVEKRVVYFLMDGGDEPMQRRDDEMQRVYWCRLAEAAERLSFETERRVVGLVARRLAETGRDPD